MNWRDTVVLSKWEIIREVVLVPIGYSSKVFSKLGSARICPIIVPYNKIHPLENSRNNFIIRNFLYDIFTNESPNSYKITAAFAEHFLTFRQDLVLAFPAIRTHANAENFIFTPSIVDNHLKIVSAKWLKVDDISLNSHSQKEYRLDVLSFSDNFDRNSIHWQAVPEHEKNKL